MRIITQFPDQPCAQGIGNDIARQLYHILFTTYGMIMKS